MKGAFQRLCFVATVFVFCLAGYARAGQQIEFSDQVLPFEKLSYIMWKPLWTDLQNKILKNFTARIEPNGDATYFAANGQIGAVIRVDSALNSDKTHRYTLFDFQDAFTIEVKTEGSELAFIPIAEILAGKLPFYPSEPNEVFTEIDIFNSRGNRLWFVIAKQQAGDTVHTTVQSHAAAEGLLFKYEEFSSPTYREFSYSGATSGGHSLTASKRKTPEMFVGTEEFFIDEKPVGYMEFQKVFSSSYLNMARSWLNFGP